MEWSGFQIKIFKRVKNTEDNIVIDAVAGSGKSTTLFKIAKILQEKSILFFAFNTHIEQYASKKLKPFENIKVQTSHAYGLSCIRKSPKFKHTQMSVTKVWDTICADKSVPFRDRGTYYSAITALRTFGCMEYSDKKIRQYLSENSAIKDQIGDIRFAINNAERIGELMARMDSDLKNYDFNDMLRFPIIYKLFNYGFMPEVLLVDETQDMSFYQFEFIKHFLANDVRIIAVGDENQAIYEFRGANGDALNTIEKMSNAVRMPLSITYRCRSNIVRHVKRTFYNEDREIPPIESNTLGGKVIQMDWDVDDPYCLKTLIEDKVEMIVSPKNKHIMNIWFALLVQHKTPSSLKGSNIITMLTKLFKALKTSTQFFEMPTKLIKMANQDESSPDYDEQMADNAEAALKFLSIDRFVSYDQIFAKLKQLDKDTTSKIHLHTVHSSKGLESESVFVINDFFESNQRMNMAYVAYTRPSRYLYIVNVPK